MTGGTVSTVALNVTFTPREASKYAAETVSPFTARISFVGFGPCAGTMNNGPRKIPKRPNSFNVIVRGVGSVVLET